MLTHAEERDKFFQYIFIYLVELLKNDEFDDGTVGDSANSIYN
jgi:hypothetical protein